MKHAIKAEEEAEAEEEEQHLGPEKFHEELTAKFNLVLKKQHIEKKGKRTTQDSYQFL